MGALATEQDERPGLDPRARPDASRPRRPSLRQPERRAAAAARVRAGARAGRGRAARPIEAATPVAGSRRSICSREHALGGLAAELREGRARHRTGGQRRARRSSTSCPFSRPLRDLQHRSDVRHAITVDPNVPPANRSPATSTSSTPPCRLRAASGQTSTATASSCGSSRAAAPCTCRRRTRTPRTGGNNVLFGEHDRGVRTARQPPLPTDQVPPPFRRTTPATKRRRQPERPGGRGRRPAPGTERPVKRAIREHLKEFLAGHRHSSSSASRRRRCILSRQQAAVSVLAPVPGRRHVRAQGRPRDRAGGHAGPGPDRERRRDQGRRHHRGRARGRPRGGHGAGRDQVRGPDPDRRQRAPAAPDRPSGHDRRGRPGRRPEPTPARTARSRWRAPAPT